MGRRLLPATLALAAFAADLDGARGAALVALFLAIPAGFALLLGCYADVIEERRGGWRAVLDGVALVLLVLSAALRSPAVVGGVPRVSLTAIVLALLAYTGVALGSLSAVRRPVAARTVAATSDDERLAA